MSVTAVVAEPVYLRVGNRIHVGARVGRGPVLTSEQCNLEKSSAAPVEVKADEALTGTYRQLCHVCGIPALEA